MLPNGDYLVEKIHATGTIGFGVVIQDYDNVSWNSNGVYKVQSYLNGAPAFGYQFDSFAFDESRYINALIDYETYKKERKRIQLFYVKHSIPLSILNTDATNGVLNVGANTNQNYRIEMSDYQNNTTKISIPIQYSNAPSKLPEKPTTTKYFIKSKRENIFSLENVTVTFPPNTFYHDFYMNFEVLNGIVKVHQDIVPLHLSFNLAIEDTISDEKDREKMFIGYYDGKKYSYYTTKRYKNTFSIYSKTFGQYKLMKDTVPPTISIAKSIEGKWISNQKNIEFFIADDLSGIKTYEGFLNGNWILLEYESKLKRLRHSFADNIVAEGKNDLKVIVTDNVGNSTIFETQFFRTQKP
jgi:hypothetical protein